MLLSLTDEDTLELLAKTPKVIIMFHANWCGSCRLFKAKFDKISNKDCYKGIAFLHLNAEECPKMRKIAQVNALPFFATFEDGKILESCATVREEQVSRMAAGLILINSK